MISTLDAFVKSLQSRHPGESRGPEVLEKPGFRLLSASGGFAGM